MAGAQQGEIGEAFEGIVGVGHGAAFRQDGVLRPAQLQRRQADRARQVAAARGAHRLAPVFVLRAAVEQRRLRDAQLVTQKQQIVAHRRGEHRLADHAALAARSGGGALLQHAADGLGQHAHAALAGDVEQAGDEVAGDRILADHQHRFLPREAGGAEQPEEVARAGQAVVRAEEIRRRQAARAGEALFAAGGQRPRIDRHRARLRRAHVGEVLRRLRGQREQQHGEGSQASHVQQPPKRFTAGEASPPPPFGAGGFSM
ncbi:MAG: hypothetical protein MOGDAGHF_01232 [Rhodocyclaceae bacterium]|nr:hypothetical protein [Rhodocyclaceae bacterium]